MFDDPAFCCEDVNIWLLETEGTGNLPQSYHFALDKIIQFFSTSTDVNSYLAQLG